MIELARTVRFCVNDADATGDRNGYAGVPAMRGLGRYYELVVRAAGPIDPVTGYFINIKEIDRAVRATAIGAITAACRRSPNSDPASVLAHAAPALDRELRGALIGITWRLSPYYGVEVLKADTSTALLRQRFEFAAAHRLHADALSAEQNRVVFGRCNNPSGHGHNYVVEPCVAVPLGGAGDPAPAFGLPEIERAVMETVVDRFDHTHLNLDTGEFASSSGLNPSVENIARVCFDLLAPAIHAASGGRASLRHITVWETEKTCCTYPAP